MLSSRSSRLLLAASLGALATPLFASEEDQLAQAPTLHSEGVLEILVTAPFARDRFELTTPASVLGGEALVREVRSTIGETLARQPGVTTSFFGPNASRPILRGLDAERVRVLTDGIGSFDVSNTSVDHAVAINPLTAQRIEVLRGPAALLFGSSAIGGVVNVIDRRIPREVPDEAVHIDAHGVLASAAEERAISGAIDLPLGTSGLVVHADASYLQTGNYRVGGFIFSEPLRRAAQEIGGEVVEDAQARGRVPNTDARTWEVAGGLAWIVGGGSIGFSVSRLESNYGIPNALDLDDDDHDHDDDDDDHDHDHGHEDIRLDMRQTRADVRAEVPLFGAFERLKIRAGWADYVHDEIEDDGEIGTTFRNESIEARAELVQADRNGWRGASGVQYLFRRFEAAGEEAFVPLNFTDQLGIFTVQSFPAGVARIDLGARFESTRVRAPDLAVRRTFDTFSGSAGLSVPVARDWRLSASLAYAERAPSAEELFADGPHAATGAFEIGNPDFAKERSTGVDLAIRGRGPGWRLEVSGFWTRFSNFIYLSPTGEVDEEEGLPIFLFQQAGATFLGFEVEGGLSVARLGETSLELTGLVDFVRADLRNGLGPVPRIPPLRLIGGLEANGGRFGGRIEVEHATRQDRVTDFETETPSYTLVNASASWRPMGADRPTAIVLSLNNIFDVEARRHSSYLKDIAPLPGRDVRLAVRLNF
jgi:iron complex outermembrane receptor protein